MHWSARSPVSDAEANIETAPDYGPRMKALDNDRQRQFVVGLFSAPPKGRGQHIWAARFAGYGKADGTSSNKVLGVIAAGCWPMSASSRPCRRKASAD